MCVHAHACVHVCAHMVHKEYNVMFTYYFSVFFVSMFVDPVKHPELTLAAEIRRCRNDCYYYGSILLKRAHAS